MLDHRWYTGALPTTAGTHSGGQRRRSSSATVFDVPVTCCSTDASPAVSPLSIIDFNDECLISDRCGSFSESCLRLLSWFHKFIDKSRISLLPPFTFHSVVTATYRRSRSTTTVALFLLDHRDSVSILPLFPPVCEDSPSETVFESWPRLNSLTCTTTNTKKYEGPSKTPPPCSEVHIGLHLFIY